MSTTTVPETLRAAATHVEEVGLYQGGNFFAPPTSPDTARQPFNQRACCAIGAIRVVDGFYVPLADKAYPRVVGDPDVDPRAAVERLPEFEAIWELDGQAQMALVEELTARGIVRIIPNWSDNVAADAAEVATVLRAAADRYERSHP